VVEDTLVLLYASLCPSKAGVKRGNRRWPIRQQKNLHMFFLLEMCYMILEHSPLISLPPLWRTNGPLSSLSHSQGETPERNCYLYIVRVDFI
jgi:hypothetical protein